MKEVFTNLIIVKRSGQRVDFNGIKIAIAIKKAFDSVYDDNREKDINKVYESVLKYIEENFSDRKTITVEQIQDIIEEELKENRYNEVYNSFTEYRKRRAISRNMFMEKQQHKFIKAIEKIVEKNFDSNSTEKSYNTIIGFGKIIANEYSKAYVLDNKYVRMHDAGAIYINNITDIILGIPERFHPIIDFNIYMDDDNLTNFIQDLISYQKEVENEVAINNLGTLLSKWVCKRYYINLKNNIKANLDILGFKEFIDIKEIENIINKENDINTDIDIFESLLINKELIKIFDKAIKRTYEELILFLKKCIKQLLISLNSNAKKNFIYTISIGNDNNSSARIITNLLLDELLENESFKNIGIIFKYHNNDSSTLEKVIKLISQNKKIIISNSKKDNLEYFIEGKKVYENTLDEENKSQGKMILATTSINIARLGIKYKDRLLKEFYIELDDLLQSAKNQLLVVFNSMANKTKDNYETLFTNNVLDDEKLDSNQKIRKSIKNGCLNIELVGIKECVMCLKSDVKDENKILIEILKHINNEIDKMIDEHKLNFILSETTNSKILRNVIAFDKAIYGSIKNVTDKNSYHTINSIIRNDSDTVSSEIKEISKLLTGGFLYTMNIPKNTSPKKISELIDSMIDHGIEIFEISIDKGDST